MNNMKTEGVGYLFQGEGLLVRQKTGRVGLLLLCDIKVPKNENFEVIASPSLTMILQKVPVDSTELSVSKMFVTDEQLVNEAENRATPKTAPLTTLLELSDIFWQSLEIFCCDFWYIV